MSARVRRVQRLGVVTIVALFGLSLGLAQLAAGTTLIPRWRLLGDTVPWVDVRAHGALCDGSTDDSAAFQAALDALRTTGGNIFVPRSETRCIFLTGLTWRNDVHMIGEGGSRHTNSLPVRLEYRGAGAFITITGLRNAGLRNLLLIDNSSATDTIGISISGLNGGLFENVGIQNFAQQCVRLYSGTSSAIYTHWQNVQGTGCDVGLDIKASGSVVSNTNTFINSQFAQSTSVNCKIQDQANDNIFIGVDCTGQTGNTPVNIWVESRGATFITPVSEGADNTGDTNFHLGVGAQKFYALNVQLDGNPYHLVTFGTNSGATYTINWMDNNCSTGNPCVRTDTNIPVFGLYSQASTETVHAAGGFGKLENLLSRPEEFDHGDWAKVASAGAAPTVSANTVNGPDGSPLTADTITINSTTGTSQVRQAATGLGTITGRMFTCSVWMRMAAVTTAKVALRVADNSDADGNTLLHFVTTDWQRFSTTTLFNTSTDTAVRCVLAYQQPSAAFSFLAWGAQLTESPGPGPYVQTVTAGTGLSNSWGIITGGRLNVGGRAHIGGALHVTTSLALGAHVVTIASNGVLVSANTEILAGTRSLYLVDCNDIDGCVIQLGTTGIEPGALTRVVNISTNINTLSWADIAGAQHAAGSFTMGTNDTVSAQFVRNRSGAAIWIETGRADH